MLKSWNDESRMYLKKIGQKKIITFFLAGGVFGNLREFSSGPRFKCWRLLRKKTLSKVFQPSSTCSVSNPTLSFSLSVLSILFPALDNFFLPLMFLQHLLALSPFLSFSFSLSLSASLMFNLFFVSSSIFLYFFLSLFS